LIKVDRQNVFFWSEKGAIIQNPRFETLYSNYLLLLY